MSFCGQGRLIEKAYRLCVGTLAAKDASYEVLFRGARNEQLRQVTAGLRARVTYLRSFSLAQPGRLTESLAELRDIMNAVKARDADAVARVCPYHIKQAAGRASTTSPRTIQPTTTPAQPAYRPIALWLPAPAGCCRRVPRRQWVRRRGAQRQGPLVAGGHSADQEVRERAGCERIGSGPSRRPSGPSRRPFRP